MNAINDSLKKKKDTGKGRQQQWIWEIGKSKEPWCECDGRTPQNAAYLLGCPWVGDGKGRTGEQVREDERCARRWRSFSCKYIFVQGGQGLARVVERDHLVTPGASVYRHILDRIHAINDSFKK